MDRGTQVQQAPGAGSSTRTVTSHRGGPRGEGPGSAPRERAEEVIDENQHDRV